jgi:hypothetical protein
MVALARRGRGRPASIHRSRHGTSCPVIWGVRRTQRSRHEALSLWPALAGVASFVVATALSNVELRGGWATVAWPDDSDYVSTLGCKSLPPPLSQSPR